MSIKEELINYATDCISGKIISGEKHIWACKRILDDFQRNEWEYYWNEEEAFKIVKWFSYLKHSKGILAGQPIILTTWQKFFLCQIYGWRNKKTNKKNLRNHL